MPYKVVSKILAFRLMLLLPEVISPQQTVFIASWHISDNVSLTQEFLIGFNAKTTSRQEVVSIDFRKAFDILRWDAIDVALECLGIDDMFWELVQACLHWATFSALVEGFPILIIQTSKRVWKGNPLSPLLFIVMLEYMFGLTRTTIGSKQYESFTIGSAKLESHIYFVDDAMFFSRALTCTFITLHKILDDFSIFPRLEINPEELCCFFCHESMMVRDLPPSLDFECNNCRLSIWRSVWLVVQSTTKILTFFFRPSQHSHLLEQLHPLVQGAHATCQMGFYGEVLINTSFKETPSRKTHLTLLGHWLINLYEGNSMRLHGLKWPYHMKKEELAWATSKGFSTWQQSRK